MFPLGNSLLQSKIFISFQTSSGISGCGDLQKPACRPGRKEEKTPTEREKLFGDIVRDERSYSEHEPEFKFAEREFAFRSLKEEGFLQLGSPDDTLFQNFVDTTDLTNKGKLNEVRKAIEQNDLILAESKNNSIVPANTIEENRKTVNDVYLKTLAVDKTEFDLTQTATLESIACQDALEGGEAVYSARVMLRMNDVCNVSARKAGGNDENSKEETLPFENMEEMFAEIYPNPNNGEFVLNYKLNSEKNGELMVFDVNGKILYKQILPQNKKQIEINSLELNTGVYFYRILINDISALAS